MKILVVGRTSFKEFFKAASSLNSRYSSSDLYLLCRKSQVRVLKETSIQKLIEFDPPRSYFQRKIQELRISKRIREENFDLIALSSDPYIPSKLLLRTQLFTFLAGPDKKALVLSNGDLKYINIFSFVKDLLSIIYDVIKLLLLDIIIIPIFFVTVFSVIIIDVFYKVRSLPPGMKGVSK